MRPQIYQAAAPRIAQRQTDVLGYGHPVDEAEVLMDEGDRQPPQRRRRVLAAIADPALVEGIDSRENLDEGLTCRRRSRPAGRESLRNWRCMPTSSSACVPPNCFDTPRTTSSSTPRLAASAPPSAVLGPWPAASIDVSFPTGSLTPRVRSRSRPLATSASFPIDPSRRVSAMRQLRISVQPFRAFLQRLFCRRRRAAAA